MGILSSLREALEAPDEWYMDQETERELFVRAEEMSVETGLHVYEAMVIIGEEMDIPDRKIDQKIAVSGKTIETVRADLRRKRREAKKARSQAEALEGFGILGE